MKLNDKEFKRFKELSAKKKANTLSKEQEAELSILAEKRKDGSKRSGNSEVSFRPGNDINWWNKATELLKDAANYKCNYVAGDPIDIVNFPFVVPGVARFTVIPTYGKSSKPTDPLNVWARDLYLKMFQKYRPASGYTAADLGITLIAAIELVKIVATYERIYGIINRYSKLNLNMPYCEEEALGLTHAQADYLRGHLSDFRYDLNELIRRAQRICLPKDISLVANAISLFGYEYLDHESPRSQIIMFQNEYFGEYDETDLSAGNVRFTKVNYAQLFNFSADNMCVYLEAAVSALIGSDSVQRIFADLVVWFGEDSMLQFIPVPEEYVVVPVYSEEILHKIHNSEMPFYGNVEPISGAISALSSADAAVVLQGYRIYQASDVIVSLFSIVNTSGTYAQKTVNSVTYVGSDQTPNGGYFTNHILDAYHQELDETLVTEGCLWKQTYTKVSDYPNEFYINETCAFEQIHLIELFQNGNNSNPLVATNTVSTSNGAGSGIAGYLAFLDWAPLSYVSTTGDDKFDAVYGDLDNVTSISANGLAKLQRAVIYSGLHTDAKVKA